LSYRTISNKHKGPSFMKLRRMIISMDYARGRWIRASCVVLLSLAMVAISALPTFGERTARVVILPFQIHSTENLGYLKEGIYDIISSRLAASGEIDVIGKSPIERVLAEMRPPRMTEEVAREAGTRLKADYVVVGSITKIGDFISLDARLLDIRGQKPPSAAFAQTEGLDQLMVKVDEFARDIGGKILGKPAAIAKKGEAGGKPPFTAGPQKSPIIHAREGVGFKKSQEFPFEIKGLDIADVDGNGKNEIVLMDGHTLWIYEYVEERLRLFQKLMGRAHQDFLSLDVSDLNGNGTAEIFVTSIEKEDLNSFILEYEHNGFKRITEKNRWYFRVLDLPSKGPTLLAQKMGVRETFSGPIYQFPWKGDTFGKGKRLKLPRDIELFGLAIADITGDGKAEIIKFAYDDRLKVISADGGDLLYKTSDKFGGSNNFLDLKRPEEITEKRVYFRGRIVTLDLDGDGRVEVIVKKNHFAMGRFFERVRLFDKGEIYDLVWDSLMLAETWRTKEIPGYIADYQVKDFDNDGEVELVVAVVSKFEAMDRSKKSTILFFELY
jgi:TolB-like protein